MQVLFQDINRAAEALKEVVHNTTLDRSRTFSDLAGCNVYLKLENMQKTGSFKIRGAYNKIVSLTNEEKVKGVIAASAGNHAQGVAYAANAAGIKATVVMPEAAPLSKVMATRGYGAEVILSGSVYDDAFQKAKEIQSKTGQTFIHAFNDPYIIAGQGTVGLEILKALREVTSIVVPVGGGGLIAGIAIAVKELAPHVKIYGVQAAGAQAMHISKSEHALTATAEAATIADGIAVREPGSLTFSIIEHYVDDIFVVDDEAIATAILMLLERSKLMVEGAGAITLAAILNGKIPDKGNVVGVISGGNVDVNFISRIIERGLVKAGRRVRISTTLADRPGALQSFLNVISQTNANVLHVLQDRVERNVDLGKAAVEVSLETRDVIHTESILSSLRQRGYDVKVI